MRQLSLEYSILVEIGRSLGGQQVVLLINGDAAQICSMTQELHTIFMSANAGRLYPHIKHTVECQPVAKISDTKVAKLWSKGHV